MFALSKFVYEMLCLLLEEKCDINNSDKLFFVCDKKVNKLENENYVGSESEKFLSNSKYNDVFSYDTYSDELVNILEDLIN